MTFQFPNMRIIFCWLQITDPNLIKILRAKVKRNEPYVGIFMKKDTTKTGEVVQSLDDIYNVGTFAQIHEVQDLGTSLKLVATAHRRIKITRQIEPDVNLTNTKGKRNHTKRYSCDVIHLWIHNFPEVSIEFETPDNEKPVGDASTLPHPLRRSENRRRKYKIVVDFDAIDKEKPKEPPAGDLLMVEVENIVHEPFEPTQEIKALKQEIIKTIRDIVTMNPIYRWVFQVYIQWEWGEILIGCFCFWQRNIASAARSKSHGR